MDNAQLTPLRKRNPEITRRLAATIEKAMEIDPGDRYQSAEAFKLALLNAKSKTQQLTGTYTIAPPPPDTERNSNGVKAAVLTHSIPLEEQAFVSPRKKQMQRTTRQIRTISSGLLIFLVVSFLLILFLAPQLLPVSARNYFPFLPTVIPTSTQVEVALPVASVVEQNTPVIEPTETSDAALQVTETASAALTQTLAPTPIGGDYLQIAYASTRTGVSQIYLTGLLGDQAIPITNMPGGACQPSWSPDGKKIVFTSPCGIKKDTYPESSLFLIDADGTNLQPLPDAPGGDFEPAWSPDGKYIAFTSLRDGYMQLYSYNVASSSVTRLVKTSLNTAARQAAWSPDSKKIVYAYKRITTYELWVMSAFGQDEEQLYISGDQLSNQTPLWSPDGKFILFSQQNTKSFTFPNLYFLKFGEESSPLKVSLGVISIVDMDYSPDNVWLAYEGGGERGYHVYYSTASGGNQARITEDVFSDDFDPVWRPIQK